MVATEEKKKLYFIELYEKVVKIKGKCGGMKKDDLHVYRNFGIMLRSFLNQRFSLSPCNKKQILSKGKICQTKEDIECARV